MMKVYVLPVSAGDGKENFDRERSDLIHGSRFSKKSQWAPSPEIAHGQSSQPGPSSIPSRKIPRTKIATAFQRTTEKQPRSMTNRTCCSGSEQLDWMANPYQAILRPRIAFSRTIEYCLYKWGPMLRKPFQYLTQHAVEMIIRTC